MLGKLFGSKKMPRNGGDLSRSSALKGMQIIKVFELELSNMEGNPTYALTHQLTIGSEIGNIVVADPSVSPRHATFILQQDVVSVIDHGSVTGTFVSGNKIPAGKYIILEETEVITVGDLEVRIRVRNERVVAEEILAIPTEEDDEVVEEIIEEEVIEDELPPDDLPPEPEEVKEDKKPKLLADKNSSIHAANALVRVFAVLCDLLLAYVIITVFMPFDDFRSFLEFVPAQVGELLGVKWGDFWNAVIEEQQFLGTMLEDIYSAFSGNFPFGPLILTFILLRLISTLIFGVTISELLLAIRPGGNKIWARVGGGMRVLVGIFTGPLLVLDVPAVVSRRTFKELITFTYIFVSSKIWSILGIVFFVPLFTLSALIAPIFQGLETPRPIAVNDVLEQRVRVATPTDTEEKTEASMGSSFLGLKLTYSPEDVSIFPELKFRGVGRKLNFKSQMIFYDRELQRPVRLELMKKFDLKQLLSIGIKGDYFLRERFPEIASYVFNPENKAFKINQERRGDSLLANEVMTFTKFALELSLNNVFESMQGMTPILKGPVEYREALLGLLEYKEPEEVGFIKIGKSIFMKASYSARRPFDLLIPLTKDEGRVYMVEFDSKDDLAGIKSKFYKYTLEKSVWSGEFEERIGETMTPFQVLDTFTSLSSEKRTIPLDQAQALYGFYFEQSAEILRKGDLPEIELWKKSVSSVYQLIENLEKQEDLPEGEEDPVVKLNQNFRDLKDAVERGNLDYFGPTESPDIEVI